SAAPLMTVRYCPTDLDDSHHRPDIRYGLITRPEAVDADSAGNACRASTVNHTITNGMTVTFLIASSHASTVGRASGSAAPTMAGIALAITVSTTSIPALITSTTGR